mmetsp:Transcript_54316/g.97483  ORF Transcript_54316/g.97483 Transcript_54316/m.97483 type:complete len:95 (-) Transcript_54316:61-345(-)
MKRRARESALKVAPRVDMAVTGTPLAGKMLPRKDGAQKADIALTTVRRNPTGRVRMQRGATMAKMVTQSMEKAGQSKVARFGAFVSVVGGIQMP